MFWKKHTEPVPVAVSAAVVEATQAAPLTAEEAARQWFKEKTGLPMPEEIKTWFRRLAHDEAVRVTTSASVLDRGRIMKLHESKRLAATKLENVERSIEAVRRKQDWIERFNELNIRLTESRAAMYEAGKRNAAQRDVQQELERYEMFEPIHGTYREYLTLKDVLQDERSKASVLKRRLSEAEAAEAQAQAKATQADKQYLDAEAQLRQVLDTLNEGYKTDGVRETLEWSAGIVAGWCNKHTDELNTMKRSLAAVEAEAAAAESRLAASKSRLQGMEPHAAMLKAGGAIMVKLDRLHEIDMKRTDLNRKAMQTAQKQRDLDDRLARLFSQDQALVGALHTLQAEVQMHRESNLGQDGTKLQARTMELKQRKQRLLMARQQWIRICALYHDIDERKQALVRTDMHLEHDEATIERMAGELRQLKQAAEQRRYTYTVSKSQNVIKLRADLREGTACSVCGAVNHPYHSDTMTEQNKLMGEWKTEAEILGSEVRGKEQQLDELRITHAIEQGQRMAEQEFLQAAREEYNALMRDWAQYADLGQSFKDCNPAVGGDAMTAMLGQLIENTDKQATEAQQELDTYNYHQMAINRAAEQIDEKENRRADLAVALNETNTGCQVMAGGVERIQKRIASLTTAYSTLLSDLDAVITLPDWAARWREGHENFKLGLRRRMDEMDAVASAVNREQAALDVLNTRIEDLRQTVAAQEARALVLQKQIEGTTTRRKQADNAYARLFGDERAADVFSRTQKLMVATGKERDARRADFEKAQELRHRLAGEAEAALALTAGLEDKVAALHGQIDEWIRVFNTTHPPVQYAELERVFKKGREWGAQRQEIRATTACYSLAQAREEDLRSAILALQADENRAMDGKGETLEALIAQRENLEARRREIMAEMAAADQQLQAHERALRQLQAMEEQ